eukprot:1420343-Pyramimonas_sp.AAC.1
MSCYALIFDTMLCHVMLCHAATSFWANREEVYAMVRDGRGRTSDMTRAHLACPPPSPVTLTHCSLP